MKSAFASMQEASNTPITDMPNFPSSPIIRESPKVGRNDPCPCGSGKKFKKCCGKN
ncbi:SEC-C domain-containing protein [Shewanella sp. 202IG2-18]|nr:SEC-C domain-containing protein [Parashewanella hymeniacidonis]